MPTSTLQSAGSSHLRAVLSALLVWIVLCAGIGIAVTITRLIELNTGWSDGALAVVQAILVSALVVPTIVYMRRKKDRLPLESMGLSLRVFRPIGIGLAVALGAGLLAWTPAYAAGWVECEIVHPDQLLTFVLMNVVLLLFFEALPEELALRGYAWTTLIEDRWKPIWATLLVLVMFSLSALVISTVQSGASFVLGLEPPGVTFAPPGDDPLVYMIQLFFFGLALIAARRIPVPGALAIAITFHIVQLVITRLVLGGLGWLESGVTSTLVEPDAILLVLAHIMLSGVAFVLIRKMMERNITRVAEFSVSPTLRSEALQQG